jgi:hypothetical protein
VGFITTITLNNDFADEITRIPDFAKQLHAAVLRVSTERPVRIGPAGITVVENHHADYSQPILVGGREEARVISGITISYTNPEPELELLKRLAAKLGYDLHSKKRK